VIHLDILPSRYSDSLLTEKTGPIE
jgi:hypothetical protein